MKILWIIVVLIIVIFLLTRNKKELVENFRDENYKVDLMKCSQDCCGSSWYTADQIEKNKNKKTKVVSSNLRCSNGVSSGCPCMNKQQYNYLANRGGNFPFGYDDSIHDSYYVYPENEHILDETEKETRVVEHSDIYSLPNHGAMYN